MKLKSVEFLSSFDNIKLIPKNPFPTIAFAGRSNVGKSSLINTILNRKSLAKTSSTPGKTRLINYFVINNNIYFADLPGYGFARVSRTIKEQWGKLVEAFLENTDALKLIIVILDIRRGVTDQDAQLLEWLRHKGLKEQIILTKADKLSNNEALKVFSKIIKQEQLSGEPILFSSTKKTGVSKVWSAIHSVCRE